MADAKDAARGSRLSMESKKRHLDDLYRFALKKCDDKAAGTFVSFFSLSRYEGCTCSRYASMSQDNYTTNSVRKVCEGTRVDGRVQVQRREPSSE